MDKRNEVIFRYLPLRIARAVDLLPKEVLSGLTEIRLRKRAPVSATTGMKNIFFREDGIICRMESGIYARDDELEECIARLTQSSLYTCDEYIAQGFVPLPEGGRAGICGRVNYRNGRLCGFAEITSVNIRLHRFLPDVAAELISQYRDNGLTGTLVCAPPALGKTTFLRSTAFLLANGKGIGPKRIALADEREEISAGLPKSGLLDVMSGIPKAQAVTMLTRTMSPQAIICDEIAPNETDALIEAQNTGVCLVASAHCNSPKELLKRGNMKKLIEFGLFPLCVVLGYNNGYFYNIHKTEDML